MAAGLGTPQLAGMAGIDVPLDDKPATLNVYTVPAPPLLRHMLLSGGFLSVNCHHNLVTEQGYMWRMHNRFLCLFLQPWQVLTQYF